MLYMFRTPFASIIRSTINCKLKLTIACMKKGLIELIKKRRKQ